jgi:hypothetical protein
MGDIPYELTLSFLTLTLLAMGAPALWLAGAFSWWIVVMALKRLRHD